MSVKLFNNKIIWNFGPYWSVVDEMIDQKRSFISAVQDN